MVCRKPLSRTLFLDKANGRDRICCARTECGRIFQRKKGDERTLLRRLCGVTVAIARQSSKKTRRRAANDSLSAGQRLVVRVRVPRPADTGVHPLAAPRALPNASNANAGASSSWALSVSKNIARHRCSASRLRSGWRPARRTGAPTITASSPSTSGTWRRTSAASCWLIFPEMTSADTRQCGKRGSQPAHCQHGSRYTPRDPAQASRLGQHSAGRAHAEDARRDRPSAICR